MGNKTIKLILAGAAAGVVTGTFGAGGGLILVPILGYLECIEEEKIFQSSVFIILSLSIVTLAISTYQTPVPWFEALPYLIGSCAGGIVSGMISQRIPVLWLHRFLGFIILYGGIRFLCR